MTLYGILYKIMIWNPNHWPKQWCSISASPVVHFDHVRVYFVHTTWI